MKHILLIIAISLFACSFQDPAEDHLLKALKRGNAAQLSDYFDANVQLELNNKIISYSKGQAELVLRDFFQSNSVKNFELLRISGLNNNLKHYLGNLNTINGLFHTSLLIRQIGKKTLIEEMHFEQ